MKEPLALTGVLLLYSNLLGWWASRRGYSSAEGPFRFTNPVLLWLLVLLVSKARKQSPWATLRQIGLGRAGAVPSVAAGALLGTILSLPAIIFFARPVLLDSPIEYGPVTRLSRRGIVRLLLLDLAVAVGLCEEAFFRGLLQDSWSRVLPPRAANVAGAAAFAGWHIAVTAATLGESNVLDAARLPALLRRHTRAIALVGGLLTTGVAGVIFGELRLRSRSLWGPIVAHWLVDGIMIGTLWQRGQLARLSGTKG